MENGYGIRRGILFDDILELQTVNGELERPQSERAMRGWYISLILRRIAQVTIREISIIIEDWIVLYKRKDDVCLTMYFEL